MKKSIYQVKMNTIVVYDKLTYSRAKQLKHEMEDLGFQNVKIKLKKLDNRNHLRRVS